MIPDLKTFEKLAQNHNYVPVVSEISGDLDTPVSVYLKLRKESDYSFLLESASQSAMSGRYSFIGIKPRKVIRFHDHRLEVHEDGVTEHFDEDPFDFLRKILEEYSLPEFDFLPPLSGGLVGFFSYDAITYLEKGVKISTSNNEVDDFNLMLLDTIIAFDHYKHSIKIIKITNTGDEAGKNYETARDEIEKITQKLRKNNSIAPKVNQVKTGDSLKIKHLETKREFEEKVIRVKEHIVKGDIFQLVLSQRFEIKIECDEFEIYRELRKINPSPYMFYLNFGDTVITGSSPEVLVKCIDNVVTTRPLAGTRKRGKNRIEEQNIIDELLNDEKEKAEHIMLVDLGRNDLGRICKFGSVKIPEFMGIEKYSHVMHIVSEAIGTIAEGKDCFDALQGCFPAGTVSGAPKIRAMELIDKYEQSKRGIYAGTIGYIDAHGNMDTCIAIRTMYIKNKTVFVQAGAGVVADSVPENEYYETLNKASALFKAIAQADGKVYDPHN